MTTRRLGCDLLVVSHPAVLPVNQLVYAELARRGYRIELVVPDRWRHEYADHPFAALPLPELAGSFHPRRVWLAGQPQRHIYRSNPVVTIRRLRPRIVFCEQEPFSVPAGQWGLAAHLGGIPFGVQQDENLDRRLPVAARVIRSWVLPHATFVAARSDTAAELARTWGARGDVRLIPHHVPGWPPPQRPEHERFTVGYAGRFVPEKGLDTLVAAVQKLRFPVTVLLAGDGELRSWLESVDLGESALEIVRGTDHAQMAEVYARMDVLVLPSRTTPDWSEQFGRVLVEALSCGTPVIGSDSGEIPWVVETTGGGVIFPEGDAGALADRLTELGTDIRLRTQLAERGRRRAAELFSVRAVADRIENVLSEVANLERTKRERKPVVALVAHGVHDHGGMERACGELIRRGGDQVDFMVVSAELSPRLRPFATRWIQIRVPPRPIPVKFVLFWALAGRALKRVNADIVHTVGAIVPNRVDIASLHFCQAGFQAATGQWAPRSAPWLRRANTAATRTLALSAERWCYRPSRLSGLAAVSEGVAKEATRHYPSVPVTVTPNGVDAERFHPDSAARTVLRSAEHVEDSFVVLFVGGDWRRKGLPLLIEALAQASGKGMDLRLWVVGNGDEEGFRRLVEQLRLESRVRFFGARRDTERYYQAADVFCMPSLYEAFSLAFLEAAACGLPLVIPPISGASELVGADEGGLLVERTPEAFGRALAQLAADPQLRTRMGNEARRRALAYTWQRSADSVLALYAELLANREADGKL